MIQSEKASGWNFALASQIADDNIDWEMEAAKPHMDFERSLSRVANRNRESYPGDWENEQRP